MNIVTVVKALGPVDSRSIQRDPLLRWLIVVPLFIALATRWLLPIVFERLGALFGFDLTSYYAPVMSTLLLMIVPILAGTVIGFLLLDQRDDNTLTALQVTPMSLTDYMVYRFAGPILLSVVMTIIALPLAGVATVGFAALLIVSFAAAPLAPLFALFLAAFAQNKVQGFALTKASGIILWPPVIAYFVPPGWQLAFGLAPTYWPAKLLWILAAGEPYAWIYLLVGLIYQFLVMMMLMRRFHQVTHQ